MQWTRSLPDTLEILAMNSMRSAMPAALPALVAILACSPAVATDKPWTLAVHGGTAELDRLVKGNGAWWAQVDDDEAALGLSLDYALTPMLGLRVMYEQADDLVAANVCPTGSVCPLVAISEETDYSAWHLALVPRYALSPNWTAFGVIGAMDWELDSAGVLPGDSGTEFTYGVGLDWRATDVLNVTLEYQSSGVDYDALRFGLGVRF